MRIFFAQKLNALFGVLLLAHISVFSQTYPVQVTTTILPPYSVFLSDYASAESNSLSVMLHVLELDRTNLRVKLRLTIEGAGITLRTRASYVPQAIVLQGGVPEMLSGFDLRSYFNPDNLDFSGITRTEFMQSGRLPEGFYTFRIEVLEYTRSVRISSPTGGQATAWVMLNDPPLINQPFSGDKLTATDPQSIFFSWTPRHTASPNAAFSTEYEFRLVELYPGQTNPDVAIRSSNSIYTTTTTLTSLNYGIMEPTLIPGKKYAFRIRARDTSGRDLFKNQGYSETYMFQYGDACSQPVNITAEALDPERIKVEWEASMVHSRFMLDVRKAGARDWYNQETYTRSRIVPDLEPNTTYEYRVQPVCGSVKGDYSTTFTITTPKVEESTKSKSQFSCGAESPELLGEEMTCMIPLQKPLLPLDMIKVGDLEVIVTQANLQPDGSYTGKGHVGLPVFNAANFRVVLRNVFLNEHYRLVGGSIATVYDQTNRPIGDVEQEEAELAKERAEAERTATTGGEAGSPDTDIAGVTTPVEGNVESVTTNEDGTITVVLEDGNTQTLDPPADGQPMTIVDSNGDTWTVGSNGTVTQGGNTLAGGAGGGAAPAAVSADTPIDFTILFTGAERQTYGFDHKEYETLAGDYSRTDLNGQDYWVAWKSVASGRADAVEARISNQNAFPEMVGFKSAGTTLPSQPGRDAHSRQVTLQGTTDGDEQALQAYVRKMDEDSTEQEVPVGQLNIATYDLIRNRLILVPVNNVSPPNASALSDELNAIYGQAVAQWEVTLDQSFKVDDALISGMDDGESGLLASFPDGMRALNREYKQARTVDKNAYYLFLIEGSGSSRAGFMPFKRQFGYIFTDNSANVTRTIAHELGHGAFHLRHTFSDEGFVASEGSTNNLMDYSPSGAGSASTHLHKRQWDNIHNPESMNGWFEDDEESAEEAGFDLAKLLEQIRSANIGSEKEFNLSSIKTIDTDRRKYTWSGSLELSGTTIGLDARVYIFKDESINAFKTDQFSYEELTTRLASYGSASVEATKLTFKTTEPQKAKAIGFSEESTFLIELFVRAKDFELVEKYLLGTGDTESGEIVYNYFIKDKDAWLRNPENISRFIEPTQRAVLGTQVALLEPLKDEKGNPVAKVKIRETGETIFLTQNDKYLAKVTSLAEAEYEFVDDYESVIRPFSDKEADREFEKGEKIIVYQECANYLRVKTETIRDAVDGYWVGKSAVRKVFPPVPKEEFIKQAKESTEIATKFKGNETEPACNICVRSALLLLREDTVLFPKGEASAFHDPSNNYEITYLKGEISGDGLADKIKKDFDGLKTNSDLNSRFTEVEKLDSEDWEIYFGRLQTKADQGKIIIGTYIDSEGASGHVMMITPGGLVEIDNITQQYGSSFSRKDRGITNVPRVLECGKNARESNAPLCLNMDHTMATTALKWFEYIF